MLTITEAIAEIVTISKRLEKKQQFILGNLTRQNLLRDPLEKEGGQSQVIARETQSIMDLCERLVALRTAVNSANMRNTVTVLGETKTLAEWIVWKREVAPFLVGHYNQLRSRIEAIGQDARRKGVDVAKGEPVAMTDIIVNVDQMQLARNIEHLEEVLGTLDGALSVKNATTTIEL